MKTKHLVVLNEYGYPESYAHNEWRHHGWSADFYIAIYGCKERLETLCDYVAQIVDPVGNLCPEFLWPEFKGEYEAYLWIQDDPQPWQIMETLSASDALPKFARKRATPYLADHTGPVVYCEGSNYGPAIPYRVVEAMSGQFPDLTFVIGGVAHCEGYEVADSCEIRNGEEVRSVSYSPDE